MAKRRSYASKTSRLGETTPRFLYCNNYYMAIVWARQSNHFGRGSYRSMKNLNGVGTLNGFGDGSIRGLGFVRNLSIAALRDLDGIKIHREYTKGARLFVEGQRSE